MTLIYTAEEILVKGLLQRPNFDYARLEKLKNTTKLKEFTNIYGASPEVAAEIWKDLQICSDVDNRLTPRQVNTLR